MTDPGSKQSDRFYHACSKDDLTYFGADTVVQAEMQFIRGRRGLKETDPDPRNDLVGLSLSGGGIRSASFSLGVMQALAHNKWLDRVDYLSTVSGGGYIGSSLTWILSQDPQFGTSPENFPYAAYPMSGEARDETKRTSLLDRRDHTTTTVKGKLLDFLRHNAEYLTPGRGVNLFSILAVALRGGIVGLTVYISLLALVFLALLSRGCFNAAGWLPFLPCSLKQNDFLALAVCGAMGFGFLFFLYALGTYVVGKLRNRESYPMRRKFERLAGYGIPVLVLLAVIGATPVAHDLIKKQGQEFCHTRKHAEAVAVSAAVQEDSSGPQLATCKDTGTPPDCTSVWGRFRDEFLSLFAGFFSLVMGVISGVAAFFKTKSLKPGKVPISFLVGVGIVGILFGIAIIAYGVALALSFATTTAVIIIVAVIVLFALVPNINHLSLHRYYRDRLMETFMPVVKEVLAGNYERLHTSPDANTKPLHTMCKKPAGAAGWPGPYHIVNANVVLASADKSKFRGRGGDNFILSPAYCGSMATGWKETAHYMQGGMTLASAMAISGAAVNPDAGCGGEGITRSPFLSMLMAMLNFRLGYWAPNPAREGRITRFFDPNFITPGLWEITDRTQLNEHAAFVQLSDGGHFENLALYEMIRRRVKLVIVCDGGADPDFTFGDLANAIEKVRADFGALVMIDSKDLQDLTAKKGKNTEELCDGIGCSKQPYLVAPIKYADNSDGLLIYLTTTFFEKASADLYGYKKEHPAFPDESTADQFFDERQFEAYRELGFQAAWLMMKEASSNPAIKNIMS